MDSNNSFAVHDLIIRQSPLVEAGGQVKQTTIVSFMIGQHGPFTMQWPGMTPSSADIITAIQAKVSELRALGQAISQINSRP